MALFHYKGFDKAGARSQGSIEADTAEQAKAVLQSQGLLIRELKAEQVVAASLFSTARKPKLADIEFFTAELAVLLESGLKIDKGIELLRQSNRKPQLQELLSKLSKDLRSGKQLSQALREYQQHFDPLYINLVEIGEATGQLSEIFRELANELAFRRDLQQKVTQALTYPAVIMAVCILAVFFVFNYVVPNMATLFAGKTDLPLYTTLLLAVSDWMQQYQWYLVAALFVAGIGLVKALQSEQFSLQWQRLQLQLPGLSSGVALVERIRFNSGLSMMLAAGVPIDVAMQLAAGSIRNAVIRAELQVAINKIKRGELLSVCLRETRLYPDLYASLLSVGEESGQLSRVFREIAQRSQKDFSAWVSRATTLLEPLLILLMGGLVGGVVVIMMLSITNVNDVSF